MILVNKVPSVVYIQDNQNSEEKRFGLNLMINMLSQTRNSTGDSLLDSTVHHIAECLIIMKVNRLPNAEQMIELLR